LDISATTTVPLRARGAWASRVVVWASIRAAEDPRDRP